MHIYINQYTRSSLAQIMACRLSGATPLYEPMLPYCNGILRYKRGRHLSQNLQINNQQNTFEECRLQNVGHMVSTSMSQTTFD